MSAQPAPEPLLELRQLRLAARRTGETLVHDLSFTMSSGERLGLVGESGSGKSLTARALIGLLPDGVARQGGAIRFRGCDLLSLSPAALRRLRGTEIGLVLQEPMVSLNPALRIGEQLAEGLRARERLTRVEIERRCLAMLERVCLTDAARCLAAYPHEFSGGMRQRIMLASAMLLRPKLLIADEPTTALDTLAQRDVMDLMVELARDTGSALLLITHNLGLVSRYTTRAVVLERGRKVEEGETDSLLQRPTHPYTQRLLASLPCRTPRPPTAGSREAALIAARGLSVRYAGRGTFAKQPDFLAVRGVDLEVRPSETVALVGGSGCGKTSLGRALLGLIPKEGGCIEFRGTDLDRCSPASRREFRLGCQMVFQDPYSSLDPRMRVADIVREPLRHLEKMSRKEAQTRARAVLADVGLEHCADRCPHELSGGQRQRVAIARALVGHPCFVVADEPVSALDVTVQAQILELFGRLQRQYGFACLFISHDLAVVEQVADRVIVLKDGAIVEQGTRDEVFDLPRHEYVRALLAATPVVAASPRISPALAAP